MADIKDLYAQNPGTVKTDPVATPTIERATAAAPTASAATATGYKAVNRDVAKGELADEQLNRITSQDSPLMKRARQEGMLAAAKRGLQSSSIAAGAAQGAMVDRAAPIAMQNSQHLLTQGLASMEATNRAAEVSTGRQTDVSVANAQMATQMSGLAAQLQTAVSQGNAEMANNIRMQMANLQTQVNLSDANAANAMRLNIMNANAELNRQYLAGTQALDLATVQGRYQQLISQNEQAGGLFESVMNNIATVLSNKDLDPARGAQAVKLLNEQLDAGLRLIDSINGGSGAGTRSQLPTPAPREQAQTITLPGGGTFQIPVMG